MAVFVAEAVAAAAAVSQRSHPARAADTGDVLQRRHSDPLGRSASIGRCHVGARPGRWRAPAPSVAGRCGRGLGADGVQTAGADSFAPVAEAHTVDLLYQLQQPLLSTP